ncbi:MAG: SAF domain-containing protein [Campylobacterota bacterium]|nr:SAF domain-containing protein [Campylobacterota bacterium]
MKFNKQIIIVLILSSLLLSAIGAAYFFYTQNQRSLKSNDQLRVVYIASKDIKKNTKITDKNLKKHQIAKKFVLATPLLKKEIIGKFAKENIYKNDIFRKEKISNKINLDINSSDINNFKFNSYNMEFKLFRNPNYSVRKGDVINIISVYPADEKRSNNSANSVQYVASNIKVIGFLLDGKEESKSIKKVKITKTVKKKKITQEVEKKANEIILDIDSKVLLELIDDYNRGNQLWMVKTHHKVKKAPKKEIVIKKKKYIKKVARTYPVRLYKAKNSTNNFKATIHYADENKAAVTKNKSIKVDIQKICASSDKFLFGISNKVHLRTGPTIEYRIARIAYRNYIIPYDGKTEKDWFITCDGYYVHKNEVTILSKDLAFKKLGKLK